MIPSLNSDPGLEVPPGRWQVRAPYWLGSVCLTLILLALTWGFIIQDRQRLFAIAEDEARSDASALTRVVEENLRRTIETIDQQSRLLRDLYVKNPTIFGEILSGVRYLLRDMTAQVDIIDAAGLVRYSSLGSILRPVDLSDREHIRVHMTSTEDILFISKPDIGRGSNLQTMQLSRKILDAAGQYAGVTIFSLDTVYLTRFHENMNMRSGILAIIGLDGVVRARAPPEDAIGLDISASRLMEQAKYAPAGVFRGQPTSASPDSFVAFRRLDDYLLIVVACLKVQDVLAAVAYDTRQQITQGTVLSLLFVLAGSALIRHQRERRLAQLALEESEARIRGILTASPDALVVVDGTGRIVMESLCAANVFGYAPGELTGQPAECLVPERFRAAHKEHMLGYFTLPAIRLMGGGLEVFARRKDGAEFPVDVSLSSYRCAIGQFVIAAVRDMTEQRKAEQASRRWSDAFEHAAFGITITDVATGTLSAVNPSYAALHGMTVAELIGSPVNALYDPKDMDIVQEHRAIAQRLGHTTFEATRLRKDGSSFLAQIALTTVGDVDGEPLYRIASLQDVSARRQMETQLQHAKKMEAVGHLTAGIAHDFNNILGAIINNQDLIIDGATGDSVAVRRHAEDALGAALSGAEMVKRLLAFSRQQAMQPRAIDIDGLIADITPLLRRAVGEQIEITTSGQPDLWLAMMDPGQVESALLNLALNARDAMADGGVLSIDTRNTTIDESSSGDLQPQKSGEYLVISMTDSGVGMAPEILSHAFEPFFTTKGVGEGTGLGLSMVLGSMQQLGGTAKIYSEIGQGTTVCLYLPRAWVQAPAEVESVPARSQPAGKERILVVEDNALIRSAVVAMLRNLGYAVEEAENGEVALTLLDRGIHVDLVFSDIILPGRYNGISLARELRTRDPEIRILLTSGFSKPIRHQAEIKELGLDILVKPYRKAVLAEKVRATLDQQ